MRGCGDFAIDACQNYGLHHLGPRWADQCGTLHEAGRLRFITHTRQKYPNDHGHGDSPAKSIPWEESRGNIVIFCVAAGGNYNGVLTLTDISLSPASILLTTHIADHLMNVTLDAQQY